MQVREIMTKNVKTVSPEATLQEAAEMMNALDIGFLPVAEGDQPPTGVITDRDLVIRGIGARRNPAETRVRDVMTTGLDALSEEAGVEEAAELMRREQIRRVVVQDAGGRLSGIVSLGDVALATRNKELAGDVVQKVSQPAPSQ